MKITDRYGTVLRCYHDTRHTGLYSVLPPRWAGETWRYSHHSRAWHAIDASADPYHPQGVGQWGAAVPGPRLGRRVSWGELPAGVQRFARQSFPEFAPKEVTP